ncbi:MAG: hypothetical protein Q4D62_10665 [Planctomycetia bacterium]|nr:hypothetical protein [Planctomycetia bacterium]
MEPSSRPTSLAKTPFQTRRERRQFVLWIFFLGVLALLIRESFRPANHELFRLLLQSTTPENHLRLADQTEMEPLPGMDESVLSAVEDRTPLFHKEAPAVKMLVELLQNTSAERLQKACLGRVLFAQYTQQPAVYRGKLIHLRGVAVATGEEKVFDDALGLKKWYPVWMLPDDCPNEPIVVYCLELPENFPTGEDIRQKVSFNAFFLKMWPYASQVGVRSTALFYAQKPQWTNIPSDTFTKNAWPEIPFWMIFLASLALAILLLMVINHRVRQEQIREELPEKLDLE